MGKTADTLLADSKSDGIGFLDRNAGKILIWAIAVSFALRVISRWIAPPDEELKNKRGDELDGEMVVAGVGGLLIGVLAEVVGALGKLLALIGFIMRGRDRERRRRAEHARRHLHSSAHESQDATD